MKKYVIAGMLLATGLVQAGNPVENAYGVESMKLGGIIGDRLDKTVYGCLMKVDYKNDFLPEFLPENRVGENGHSYVALGKSMIAADYFAAYTGDPEVAALKNEMIQSIIQTQDEDGYIGTFKPGKLRERNKKFGYHETCYIAHGLSMNYKIFGDEASLKAAEGASGWQMDHFFDEQTINPNIVWPCLWGFEESLMNLYALNQDPEIIEFMNKAFLPEGNLATVWKAVTGQNSKGDSFGPNHSHAYNYLSTALGMEKLNLVQPN
ncbi:MAG: glycoside hydrolase family 127 protein [Deltaproteobacteria bacterium]